MVKLVQDVVLVGGGAAGLLCAIEAGKRGKSVIVLEHNPHVGEKIRISGGGRCNFTNVNVGPHNYISANPHFCKSALSRYPSSAIIGLVERHGIAYHEKKLGQLFCDGSAEQIIDMLLNECKDAGVTIQTRVRVNAVRKSEHFEVDTSIGTIQCRSLVVATGGVSVPKLGSTDFGYRIARQFGCPIIEPKPGLVPLTAGESDRAYCASLSGVSLEAIVSVKGVKFRENILFTHVGLSGPAILQLSSYWSPGDPLTIDLLAGEDAEDFLLAHRASKSSLATILEERLPRRFCRQWCDSKGHTQPMVRYSKRDIRTIGNDLNAWRFTPEGTEGFKKAEVTVGGVDTDCLSSKTMEVKHVDGLYFVGEAVDVTGWLGGYNFQWAWSSGWVAGQYA